MANAKKERDGSTSNPSSVYCRAECLLPFQRGPFWVTHPYAYICVVCFECHQQKTILIYVCCLFQVSGCQAHNSDDVDPLVARRLFEDERRTLLPDPADPQRRQRRDTQPDHLLHPAEALEKETKSHVSHARKLILSFFAIIVLCSGTSPWYYHLLGVLALKVILVCQILSWVTDLDTVRCGQKLGHSPTAASNIRAT